VPDPGLAEVTVPGGPARAAGDTVPGRPPPVPGRGGAPDRADPAGSGEPTPLRRCVAVGEAEFAARYWGRAPLMTRAGDFAAAGRRTGFDDLLDVDGVDELLSRRGLRAPFLRVAKDGRLVPVARYTGSGGAGAEIADQVLDERVLALYADGATLVLQGLHRTWPPLVEFAARLGEQLGCPVQVNAYLTPAGNRGFATHYDTHDVFVLQVAGRKQWRVHPPVLPDPLERQAWGARAEEVEATAAGPSALEAELTPGDALYLPRGWLHSARALGERSLHLTLGLRRPTRYDLVEALLGLAAEEARLRAGFPMGLDLTDADQLAPHLAATVDALRAWLSTVDPQRVADRLRHRHWAARRPGPIRPVAQAEAAATVNGDSLVAVRPGLCWRLVPAGPGRVALALPDRTLDLPEFCAPAVRAALGGPPVRVRDLPGLDVADGVVLVRRLLREAVVTPQA